MKKLFQCQRAFTRFEVEQYRLSVWELMYNHEKIAKEQLLEKAKQYDAIVEITCDWQRQRKPDRFMLRAWCLIEVFEGEKDD